MTLDILLDFIKNQDKKLIKRYPSLSKDKQKQVLAYMVKLTEEMGELSEQVLFSTSMQRNNKINGDNKEELAKEISDVLISTLVLATALNINVKRALSNRLEKIEKRDKELERV